MTDRQKEPPRPRQIPLDEDLIDRARQLINMGQLPALRGQQGSAAQTIRDTGVYGTLEQYFAAFRAADVQDALSVLRHNAATGDEIKRAVKALAAYFLWTEHSGTTHTVDREPIEPLAAQFAVELIRRLTARQDDAMPSVVPFWPAWRRPDVALGWSKPKHRVVDPRIAERDLLIIQEALKQEAAKRGALKREAAKRGAALQAAPSRTRLISPEIVKALGRQFSLSPAAIRAAVAKHADELLLLLRDTDSKPD